MWMVGVGFWSVCGGAGDVGDAPLRLYFKQDTTPPLQAADTQDQPLLSGLALAAVKLMRVSDTITSSGRRRVCV